MRDVHGTTAFAVRVILPKTIIQRAVWSCSISIKFLGLLVMLYFEARTAATPERMSNALIFCLLPRCRVCQQFCPKQSAGTGFCPKPFSLATRWDCSEKVTWELMIILWTTMWLLKCNHVHVSPQFLLHDTFRLLLETRLSYAPRRLWQISNLYTSMRRFQAVPIATQNRTGIMSLCNDFWNKHPHSHVYLFSWHLNWTTKSARHTEC